MAMNGFQCLAGKWGIALIVTAISALPLLARAADGADFDVLILGGMLYDGSGGEARRADVGIRGDRIVAVGSLKHESARIVVRARGLAVAPGFINELSDAEETLLTDGRGLSDVMQGVTLEIVGEGASLGPVNERTKPLAASLFADGEVPWSTFGGYLDYLEKKGTGPNVASYFGAATPRIYVLGYDDRAPTASELSQMQDLTRQAMREGALGVSSALIYPPASFATTAELTALARVAHEHGGIYASHLRSEGHGLLSALDEILEIGRASGAPVEIHHLKIAGESQWSTIDSVLAKLESARSAGTALYANMYPYTAGSTGLRAILPPWLSDGGWDKVKERLRDPVVRARVVREMTGASVGWENFFELAGPKNIVLLQANNPMYLPFVGKSLQDLADSVHRPPAEAAIDLMLNDDSGLAAAFFVISEDNVSKEIRLPWITFCSDGETYALDRPEEGTSRPHPRAFGAFARVLGKYVRAEHLLSLSDAIHRMTGLPAERLKLRNRGRIQEGFFADVVVFDPREVGDRATYARPRQYSRGVSDVLVNGAFVVRAGRPTNATPGRAIRGPGWIGAAP